MAKAPAKKTARKSTTRARATTARKTSTSLKDVAEASVATDSPEASMAFIPTDVVADGDDDGVDLMRKKELIEAAVARAGVKKRDAKPAIEAALSILGETLASGRGLNMPELGKVKVQNSKDLEGVKVVNLRLRRKTGEALVTPEESGDEGLAEAAE